MKKTSYRVLAAVDLKATIRIVACLSVLAWSFALASDGPDKTKPGEKQSLYKGAGTPRYGVININNLTSWHRSDGQSNHSPSADNGAYYPKGTLGNVVYQDGIVFGSRVYTGGFPGSGGTPASLQPIRVGGSTYGVGTREGWVTGQGATATAISPADARARMYRVRRDYANMSPDEARADAQFTNELASITEVTDAQVAALIAQYDKDWKEWPVSLGAPFIDRNGNGVYNAPPAFSTTFTVDSLIAQNRDEPGVAGADPNSPADQVLWTAYNDLDRTQALGFEGSEHMGLEFQKTVWAYKRTDALGNLYFVRYKLLNRGGVDIGGGQKGAFYFDEMYLCQWSDIDLGSFSDDLAGCDSVLSMGFVYNANAIDPTFRKFGLPPPASGYDFLAGPIVPAAGQSAVFDLKIRPDFRNLGMSSFAYFSAGSPYSDPPGGSGAYSTGTGRWYKMLRGFAPLGTITDPDQPYASGPFAVSKFPLSGDATARTGFLDGLGTAYSFAPGDRRILLNTGPFRMAPGDTQEVTLGFVVGLGADRLSSVAVMKFNDRFVQNTYNALFQVPKPPLAPDVKVAELDGQVILEWGSNLQRVKDIEDRIAQPGAYKFEGYNIYQLPSRASRLSEGKRIITYDLLSDPTVVLDEQFDQNSGQILSLPVQFGTNSGVTRFFNVKRDYARDIDKIYNGQEYYFVVTAYSVATVPGFLPAALESDPIVLTARPKVPFGKVYGSRFGDTLKVAKTGVSDGTARPIVVDPTASTGNAYAVRFADAGGGNTTWSLVNTTKNQTLLTGQTNQSGDDDYKMVEGGIFLKVEGPPPGMKDWDVPAGTRRITFADASGLGFEGFEGAIGWDDPAHYFGTTESQTVPASQLKNVVLVFAQASASSATNGLSPYGAWDRDASTDVNMSYGYRYVRAGGSAAARPEFAAYLVNPGGGSYGYNDYKISVPLSAWNNEATPPARLAVGFLENNVAGGLVDGRYYPPSNAVQDNTASSGPREWLFIFNKPYTGSTPDASLQVNIINNGLPVMWWASFNRRGNNPWNEPTGTNKFLILANHVNTPATVFTYTTSATQTGLELEKQSAERVGVFPNPYYAFNAAETNRFFKFVTFNNLPRKATFRIFNLAGQLVRTIEKDDASQFLRWDLNNTALFPVASGMYIVYIDMPDLGTTKILKLAVIQEQEVLDSY